MCMCCDFITFIEERHEGYSPSIKSMEDFNNMIMDWHLCDIGFFGSNLT